MKNSIVEKIRNNILGGDIQKLMYDPNDTRTLFVNDFELLEQTHIKEYLAWYSSDGDEILNFYTSAVIQDFPSNPIYFRNCKNYFWAKNVTRKEANFKKVHSGLPKNIITTLVNNVGTFKINATQETVDVKSALENVLAKNDFASIVSQKQLPLTLVCGSGAYKIILDKDYKFPLVEFYTSENCYPIYKYNQLVGIIFVDMYKINDVVYYLYDTRFVKNGNSYIHYELYMQNKMDIKNNEATRVELSTLKELSSLQDLEITGYNKILGEYCCFFKENSKPKSIFAGVCDRFDELDQTLSVGGRAIKTSSPIEYYRKEALGRDSKGNPILPSEYDRNYVELNGAPNGDGTMAGQSVFSTQPVMNVQMYQDYMTFLTNLILLGILSPATIGIDVSRKDNAQAQREKEKMTILMRNNIVEKEKVILHSLFTKVLDMLSYIVNGFIDNTKDFSKMFSVSYDDFYAPTFETKLSYLGSAYANNGISTKLYVNMLWGDKLTEKQKIEEIDYLANLKQQDSLEYNNFDSIANIEKNNEESNTPRKDIRAII